MILGQAIAPPFISGVNDRHEGSYHPSKYMLSRWQDLYELTVVVDDGCYRSEDIDNA